MNKQNKGNQVFFVLLVFIFPGRAVELGGKGGISSLCLQSQLRALHLCRAVELVSVGGVGGERENRVSLRKTHQSSCPPLSALMGGIRGYGSCSGGWGREGVGRSRARPYNQQQLLFSSPFSPKQEDVKLM